MAFLELAVVFLAIALFVQMQPQSVSTGTGTPAGGGAGRFRARWAVAWASFAIALGVPVPARGQTPTTVNISVDATAAGTPLERIWPFHGYDEVNYSTTSDGQALLKTLAEIHTTPVHIRTHFLLNTGNVLETLVPRASRSDRRIHAS